MHLASCIAPTACSEHRFPLRRVAGGRGCGCPAARRRRRSRRLSDSGSSPSDHRVTASVDSASTTVRFAGVCLLGPGLLARLPNPERSAQLHDFAALAEQLGARRRAHAGAGGARLAAVRRRRARPARHEPHDAQRAPLGDDRERLRWQSLRGAIAIHPTARVTSSVIVGPVMIGADALIARLLHRPPYLDRRARAYRRSGARALDRARRRERAARGRAPGGERRRPPRAHLPRLLDAARAAPAGRRRRRDRAVLRVPC